MARYLANRLVQLVFVLMGVSVIVFVTMHLLPGDVAQLLLGDHATAEQLVRLRQQLGLDQPVWSQYLHFLQGALTGDLGTSIQSNRPALLDVLTAFPVTLQLPSRPGESHPEPLTDPDLTLSRHPARATERRLPPSAEIWSSSCCQLARSQRR